MSAAISNAVEFDADTHTYQQNGRRLPSVTQIIGAVIPRQHNPGEWYLQRGSAVHRAIELLASDCLDWETVDPRIKPRLDALLKFQLECRARIVESELRLASRRYGFAGTIDALVEHNSAPQELALTDFKNGIEAQIELQLGAYWLLLQENKPTLQIKRGLGLHLKETGAYSCRWFDRKAMVRAGQTFLSALTVFNWMKSNNVKGATRA